MRVYPQSRSEWGASIYFLLRAYVIIAFVGVQLLLMKIPNTRNIQDAINLILFGYTACLFAFLVRGIVGLAARRADQAGLDLISAAVTFLLGYYLLPTLS